MAAYQIEPGEHLFMVVGGENADFMTADVLPNKTYYVLILARPGRFRVLFSFKAVDKQEQGSKDFKEIIASSTWVAKTAEPSSTRPPICGLSDPGSLRTIANGRKRQNLKDRVSSRRTEHDGIKGMSGPRTGFTRRGKQIRRAGRDLAEIELAISIRRIPAARLAQISVIASFSA